MEGAYEYIVVGRPEPAFEALRDALCDRELPIVEDDDRHLRLAFTVGNPDVPREIKALCAVLDAGHGLSKIVIVCFDELNGNLVAPDLALSGLFMQVGARAPRIGREARRLQSAAAEVKSGIANRSAMRPWRRPRSLTVTVPAPSFRITVRTMHAPARITSARFGWSPTIVRRSSAPRCR